MKSNLSQKGSEHKCGPFNRRHCMRVNLYLRSLVFALGALISVRLCSCIRRTHPHASHGLIWFHCVSFVLIMSRWTRTAVSCNCPRYYLGDRCVPRIGPLPSSSRGTVAVGSISSLLSPLAHACSIQHIHFVSMVFPLATRSCCLEIRWESV